MPLETPRLNPDTKEQSTLYTRSFDDVPPGMSATEVDPTSSVSDEDEMIRAKGRRDNWLIQRAQTIFNNSTNYLDSNITNQWSKNLAYFRGEHAPGTAMRGLNFRRSRVFRPKTRTNVKAQEASIAQALFATKDQVDVKAQNPSQPQQNASAAIMGQLLDYRLENTIPWFLTAVGAFQDTKVYGVCISHQFWDYQQDTSVLPAFDQEGNAVMGDDGTGKQVAMGTEKTVVRADRPVCDLIAPENFRFDPMCDWRDPATSSPFLLYMQPIYASDALEMMQKQDTKTNSPAWRQYTLQQILGTRKQSFDRTRMAREGQHRIDPSQTAHEGQYTTLWAHLNIVKINGDDMAYWTLGTELILTEPMRLTDMYPHLKRGERPFRVGFSSIETHRNYPAGDVEQGSSLQEEINSIANQRLDNVMLVLNKRYFVRRGSMTDLDALIRNTPGGGVMMNDPEKDVKVVDTNDVTSSSYQEQDRLSAEFDSLVGNFSPAAPQNNEKQTPALGVAKMGNQSAGAIQDYSIRVFIETWVAPVLRQLARLEAMYETDEVILAIAADKAQLFQKFGVNQVTDSLLQQDLTIDVNVGIGNTDPQTRVQKLVYGLSNALGVPGMQPRVKATEVADEIFGALGYRDSTRFFMTEAEAAKAQEGKQPEIPPEIQVKMEELKIREKDNAMRDEREKQKIENELELGYATLAVNKGMKLEMLYTQLGIAKQKDQTHRDVAALAAINKTHEINTKRAVATAPKPPSTPAPTRH